MFLAFCLHGFKWDSHIHVTWWNGNKTSQSEVEKIFMCDGFLHLWLATNITVSNVKPALSNTSFKNRLKWTPMPRAGFKFDTHREIIRESTIKVIQENY